MLPQLLGLVTQPIYLDLIPETKIEQQIEIPPELTLQEKIDSNYYGCNPTRIRADTAECLPDLVYVAPKTVSTPKPIRNSSYSSSNTYIGGQCTWFIKNTLSWVPNGWGNANAWDSNARRDGFTVSNTPIVGSVAQSDKGVYGHLAVVTGIVGNTVKLKEMNYKGEYIISTRTAPITDFEYIY